MSESRVEYYCRVCYKPNPPDSSGRCFDCVNAAFNRAGMEQRDKRSVWKLRDLWLHKSLTREPAEQSQSADPENPE